MNLTFIIGVQRPATEQHRNLTETNVPALWHLWNHDLYINNILLLNTGLFLDLIL